MVGNAHERKHDHLARQIETAKLCASHCADLAASAMDSTTREMARRYEAFWHDVIERRTADMRGGEQKALRVKS